MTPERRRSAAALFAYPVIGLILCMTVIWQVYWPAGGGLDVTGHQIGRDFINNWVGPRLAFGGQLATLFDLEGYAVAIGEQFGRPLPFHNWAYPPFTLVLFWPLAQLPYFVALALWTSAFFVIYVAVGLAGVARGQKLLAFALLAVAPATLINAVGGQNGFATAALFMGGLLVMDRRPILAGVLFGLLTAKPQLGLVLPLFLLSVGAWRTIGAACATTALLTAVSLLAFGLEPWRHYLGETSAYQLALLKEFEGFYTFMMTSVLAQARVFGASFGAAATLQALVSVPVLFVSAWAASRAQTPQARAFVLASAAPLITPYAFNYDLTALTMALTCRLVSGGPVQPKDLVLRLAWLTPILIMPMSVLGVGIAPIVLILVFVIAVLDAVPQTVKLRQLQAAVT